MVDIGVWEAPALHINSDEHVETRLSVGYLTHYYRSHNRPMRTLSEIRSLPDGLVR